MPKLSTLKYDPAKGYDTMVTVANLPFNPRKCLTREEAAKGLYEALNNYAIGAGYSENSVSLWSPEEAYSRGYGHCWMISWEEGPYQWAINMSFDITGPWGYVEPYHSFDLCFTA